MNILQLFALSLTVRGVQVTGLALALDEEHAQEMARAEAVRLADEVAHAAQTDGPMPKGARHLNGWLPADFCVPLRSSVELHDGGRTEHRQEVEILPHAAPVFYRTLHLGVTTLMADPHLKALGVRFAFTRSEVYGPHYDLVIRNTLRSVPPKPRTTMTRPRGGVPDNIKARVGKGGKAKWRIS